MDTSRDHVPTVLPGWSSRVGDTWCKEFLVAGAELLKAPSLLSSSPIDSDVTIASRNDSIDAPEAINKVVALAEAFRPVEDIRVSAIGHKPKIDIVLSGGRLRPDELDLFLRSVQGMPAEVTILPSVPDSSPLRPWLFDLGFSGLPGEQSEAVLLDIMSLIGTLG